MSKKRLIFTKKPTVSKLQAIIRKLENGISRQAQEIDRLGDIETKLKSQVLLSNWDWPFQRVNFDGAKEYACPHDVGHGGIHGCDGCCTHPSYEKARGKK